LKEPRGNFRKEATFYLANNDFDYRKAVEAYEGDLKFEQEFKGEMPDILKPKKKSKKS
jgi:hypothetical protein